MEFFTTRWLQVWNWLVCGNNATAVATLTAVAAFLGLWFYTVYTRRMMQIAQETRRAEIYPVLVMKGTPVTNGENAQIEILNIGGPAVTSMTWTQLVSDKFRLIGGVYLMRDPSLSQQFKGALQNNQTIQITVHRNPRQRTLHLIDCEDTRQGKHQFEILIDWRTDVELSVEAQMVHPDLFLPFWKRWIGRVQSLVTISWEHIRKGKA